MIPGNELRKGRGLERLHPLVHDGVEAGSLRSSCCVEDGGVHGLFNMVEKQVGKGRGMILASSFG